MRRAREWTRRSPTGGRCSRRWSRSPVAAWCTARRSCSWTAPGAAHSRRRTAPASASSRRGIPRQALARYRQGELLRLQGDFARAEEAYREASALRLGAAARSRPAAARAGSHRRRRRGHPPRGIGDDGVARACEAASRLRRDHARRGRRRVAHVVPASSSRSSRRVRERDARGDGRARARRRASRGGRRATALVSLRQAGETWHALDAPYEIARTRVLVGDACRLLGDEEAAALELDAAREHLRAPRRDAGSRTARARSRRAATD